MSEQLKPCPFCGGKAVRDCTEYKHGATYSVLCEECGVEVTRFAEIEAIKAWNRRAI